MILNNWHEKVLKKHKKEVVYSAIISIIIAVLFSLWHYSSGEVFQWIEFHPISAPSLFSRAIYSALTFISVGALLYTLGFYKLLHDLIVKTLGNWRLYKKIKEFIWTFLILFMMFKFIPWVVDFLNAIISFFYNIWILLLYLFPSLIIFTIPFLIILFVILIKEKSNIL